jgi:hypothetical protein
MAMMAADAMAKGQEVIVTGARLRREELADYQLYLLNERTGVAPKQTKQVMLLSKDAVRFDRVLRYEAGHENDGDVEATTVLLRAQNEEARGLGDPLPRGTVRVFAPFADRGVLFSGEADVRDTPVGVEWEIATNESYDVTVREIQVSRTERDLSGDRTRVTERRTLDIANATSAPQTVEIAQTVSGDSLRISEASARHAMKYGQPTWTLVVPAHARTTLSYTVRFIE